MFSSEDDEIVPMSPTLQCGLVFPSAYIYTWKLSGSGRGHDTKLMKPKGYLDKDVDACTTNCMLDREFF